MRRRDFLTLLSGTAATWPIAARAQQGAKVPAVGYLQPATLSTRPEWTANFLQRLRELGWIEGRTIRIDFQDAGGSQERIAEIADEFVKRKVDVIVAPGTQASLAARQATSLIPIVFVAVGDPLGFKLAATLARPGGNITGLTNQNSDLLGKRIELLREMVPDLHRLAILVNSKNPASVMTASDVRAAARTLGIEVVTLEIRQPEDIAATFEGLKGRAQALYVTGDPVLIANQVRLNTLIMGAHLPAIHNSRESVDGGGLMSYGPNLPLLYRRAAEYVDKILRGTSPADIPVEQPTKYDLVINSTTARVLGLAIPPTLLISAEVIE
jgi:putative ABC transport system substrate-binding protein